MVKKKTSQQRYSKSFLNHHVESGYYSAVNSESMLSSFPFFINSFLAGISIRNSDIYMQFAGMSSHEPVFFVIHVTSVKGFTCKSNIRQENVYTKFATNTMVGAHRRTVSAGIDNGQIVALDRPVHHKILPKHINRFINIPSNRE